MIRPKTVRSWEKWVECIGVILMAIAATISVGAVFVSIIFSQPIFVAAGFFLACIPLSIICFIGNIIIMPR